MQQLLVVSVAAAAAAAAVAAAPVIAWCQLAVQAPYAVAAAAVLDEAVSGVCPAIASCQRWGSSAVLRVFSRACVAGATLHVVTTSFAFDSCAGALAEL